MQIGIAIDNTIPLHIPSFMEFIRAHSRTIRCRGINRSFRFARSTIDYDREVADLSTGFIEELKGNDLSLLLTTTPFSNNFFYIGRGNLFIISFSDWNRLTSLPMSNGLAYMICQIILKHKMKIG
jgi:hypothetical protein